MLLLYGVWLLSRCFVFDQFVIPTSSMSPTLESGDRVVVNKLLIGARIYKRFDFNLVGQPLDSWRTRGLRSLRHNDIVIFNYPIHHGRISFVINHVYCKRVIGLPGDTISAVNGYFRNNNYSGILGCMEKQKQLESKDEHTLRRYGVYDVAPRDSSFKWNIKDWGPLYVPRKDDIITITPYIAILYRKVLEWETGKKITWNWKTRKVYSGTNELSRHCFKHNYYHLCGDYTLDSFDSRYWGLVPEEYIVGVVTRITYSIDPYSGKRRKERTLKHV